MSYHRQWNGPHGGGRRRQQRDYDDYADRRAASDSWETPESRLKAAIIKFGEVDAAQELPTLAAQLRTDGAGQAAAVAEGLRLAATEQPYKIPHYATLIRVLHDTQEGEDVAPGPQILDDFWKGFQAYLDKLAWRETRLCVHLFAHLTVAGVISSQSMLALLQSFVAVLDEFGVSLGRAKQAARCAAEGLMRAGPVLVQASSSQVAEMVQSIQNYVDSIPAAKKLVQPFFAYHADEPCAGRADEILDSALASLKILAQSDFAETPDSYVQPYTTLAEYTQAVFELPAVLVPPEVIELEALNPGDEEAPVKKEEWPEYYLRLFDDDITPNPNVPVGYAVHSDLLDIVDIFEINRKECARLLVEYPKWAHPGTFKSRPGAPADQEPVPGKDWQLESCLIEAIIGSAFMLPEAAHKTLYHITLITELCKLSPQTVGPAVGKSVRKLYAALADGLDVEVARRFAEWFSVHMSNFGFQWVWKEWIPDLELPNHHPKREFHRKAIELEIRLAYHDRIMKTLPPPFQDPENRTVSEQAPGPEFDYDDPARPRYDAAQTMLNLLRGRSKADEVITSINSLKGQLADSADGDVDVDSVARSIVVQSLLHIGSRSFSHFLNAMERYLPVLRHLTNSGRAEARNDVLTAAALFWRRNRQMVAIVFDKLVQYQIVDPTDVVRWTFTHGSEVDNRDELNRERPGKRNGKLGAREWDLLKGAVDKANGRVALARRRVTALRKEEDDSRALAKAGDAATTMAVDAETKQEETPADSPALQTAVKAHSTLTSEQKGALSAALEGFVTMLVPVTSPGENTSAPQRVISEDGWNNRATWGDDEWDAWETWAWYRHFCRTYAAYLRGYSTTLGTIAFAKLEGSSDPAAAALQKIWNIAIGAEV